MSTEETLSIARFGAKTFNKGVIGGAPDHGQTELCLRLPTISCKRSYREIMDNQKAEQQ